MDVLGFAVVGSLIGLVLLYVVIRFAVIDAIRVTRKDSVEDDQTDSTDAEPA